MTFRTFWSQNKQIIVVAMAIFVISLATVLFFVPNSDGEYVQADLLNHNSASTEAVHDDGAEGHIEHNGYLKLLEDPKNPYFALNKDAKITRASESFAKMVNLSPDSTEGLFLFDFVAKEHHEVVFKAYRDVYAGEKPLYKAGPFIIANDDVERVVFMSFMNPEDSEGVVLIEVFDVTNELKHLQEHLEENEDIDEKTRIVVQRLLFAKAD